MFCFISLDLLHTNTHIQIGLTALHVAAAFGQTEFVSEMLTLVPATIKSERPLIDPSGDVSGELIRLIINNLMIIFCFIYFISMALHHCTWPLKVVTKMWFACC